MKKEIEAKFTPDIIKMNRINNKKSKEISGINFDDQNELISLEQDEKNDDLSKDQKALIAKNQKMFK